MGAFMGLLPNVSLEMINRMLLLVRPAYLQLICGPHESIETLDIKRAEFLRSLMSN
jgi:protein-arginine kinase